jgi:hypothetical protein
MKDGKAVGMIEPRSPGMFELYFEEKVRLCFDGTM